MGRPFIDLTGKRFGSWAVLGRAPNNATQGETMWLCRCDCGTERTVFGLGLRNGRSQSCGCSRDHGPRSDALVISAADAAARGFSLYFTGVPCKHGHVGPRRVSDRYCCECKRRNIPAEPRGPQPRELLGQNIREFDHVSWPDNGRIETVVDPNWLINGKPRVVRRIGWRACMCCKRRFFSVDIAKIRICDQCKDLTSELTYDRMRERVPEKRPRRPRYVYQFISGATTRAGV